MKYERFEDLPVWTDAANLGAHIIPWAASSEFSRLGDVPNQLQRAALSISNNIAEGFERGTTSELLTFLYYARGSAAEVRSILCVLERMGKFAYLAAEITSFKGQAESISRQLRAWAAKLQNSDIDGQRHLNDRSRSTYDYRKRQDELDRKRREFLEKLAKDRSEALRIKRSNNPPENAQ